LIDRTTITGGNEREENIVGELIALQYPPEGDTKLRRTIVLG
jgi:hypothetical protein